MLPDGVVITNPLDHTNALWADTEAVRALVEALADDPGVNQVLLRPGHPRGDARSEHRRVEGDSARVSLRADIPGVTKAVAVRTA